MTDTHLDLDRHQLEGFHLGRKVAVFSIDVEKDYTGTGQDALDRLPEVLATISGLGIPLTAFVEGQLFHQRPDLCESLLRVGADVQIHCHDHTRQGDDVEDVERSIEAYTAFTGRRPEGYRAHTYRLDEQLLGALYRHGFSWDSSLLPGWGLGSKRDHRLRGHDFYRLDGRLLEFPVATWRTIGVPFVHSYRRLLTPVVEYPLRALCDLPDLLIYDMHMVDLVRDGRQWAAPLPLWLKALYTLSWAPWERDSLANLIGLVGWMEKRGYAFSSLADLRRELREVYG